MVLLPNTQHISYQHWHRDLGGTTPKVPWLGRSLGKEEMMHLWNAANNYLLLLRKQWFSMIHAWQKKIPWRNLHWCKSEHFSQTVLGTFLFPGCFPSPEFAMKSWHGPLLTAPLYMSLEILCRRARTKCPLCSERLAENEPCAQQSGGSSEKVNAARARGSMNGTVHSGRHRLLHPTSSLVQPFLTFPLSPILHLQHTSLTNILHMFFLKYLEYLPNFTLLIWQLCKTNKH